MNENKHFLIPNPKSIICIGLNYADHIAETSLATHDFPEIFMKALNALAGNHDTITIEDETFHYDYEGELVIIIGKSGKNISPEKAIEHILGIPLAMTYLPVHYNLEALNGFLANRLITLLLLVLILYLLMILTLKVLLLRQQ